MATFRQMIQAQITLSQGGVITYPTEAVYGYGCDPFSQDAVARLLAIKDRPWQKGLILIAANQEQLAPLLSDLTPEQQQQLDDTWPGPVTWLVPDPQDLVPRIVKGEHGSVAVRVCGHPLARRLCEQWGGPIVSTSANRSGEAPCYTELSLRQRLQHLPLWYQPDAIVGGPTLGLDKPSVIRDLITGDIIRA
ncbi:MAG: Sua5/YciO/YrdC/YwlC family protein [Ketobacteraceae bacterium]|nr:Sua5/YciO/YrdC/YwlC family protein [Ketobacteraceae bacterium]